MRVKFVSVKVGVGVSQRAETNPIIQQTTQTKLQLRERLR